MARLRFLVMIGTGLAASIAAPAMAQRPVGGGFSITGGATATTDYRFRGISQTDERPALQATATLSHDSGFYAGAWGSTLGEDPRYGNLEVDVYAGYTREIATATQLDVGLLYYIYPDNNRRAFGATDYVEPYASVRHTIGPITAQVGAFYAPEQDALGGDDNLYVFAGVESGIPFTPVTVTGQIGRSDGGLAPGGNYLDWRVGMQVTQGPATIALEYVDSDLPQRQNTDSALVLSLRFGF